MYSMGVYYFLSLFLFFFCFISLKQNTATKTKIAIFLLFLLLFFDGLRWENGTDWTAYYDFFFNSNDDKYAMFEPGYALFNKIVYSIFPNYTFYLLSQAFLTYFVLWHFIKRYSSLPLVSIMLYFLLFVSVQGMNRQFIAILVCLYSVDLLLYKKKWHFISAIIIASTFHSSAVVFLFGLFLNKTYSTKFYVLVLIVVTFLSSTSFVAVLIDKALAVTGGDVAMRLLFYSEKDSTEFASSGFMMIAAIIKRLTWIVPILWYRDKRGQKLSSHDNLFLNYYFIGLIFYLLFNGSMLQILVARASIYFNLFEIILIPYVITLFKKKLSLQLMVVIVFLYGLMTMTKGIDQYNEIGGNPFIPYKSIFYNQNVRKNV